MDIYRKRQTNHFQKTYSDRQDRAKPISIVLRHVGSPASGFGSCRVLFPVISAGICGRFGIQSALFKPKTVEVGVTKNKIERPSVLMHKSAQYSKFQVRMMYLEVFVTGERFCRLCCACYQVAYCSDHVVWEGVNRVLMEKGVRDAKCFPRSFAVTNGRVTNGLDVIVTKIPLSSCSMYGQPI